MNRNLLKAMFVPHPQLSSAAFGAWALDFLVFGNAYLKEPRAFNGCAMAMKHSLANYTRRGEEDGRYFFVRSWQEEHEFRQGSVFHLREDDINQEIYGLPEYLSALHSTWLSEAATIFRRKYYANGSHAGFILYLTEWQVDDKDSTSLHDAPKSSKGRATSETCFCTCLAARPMG